MPDVNLLTDNDFRSLPADDAQGRGSTRAPILPPPRSSRRSGLRWNWVSFCLVVVLPTAVAAGYFYFVASDQYISEFRFRLRHAQPSQLESASVLSGLSGASAALETMTDSEIVVQYLQSRQVLDDIKPVVDLDRVYGRESADWYARLDVKDAIEDKVRYWRHVVDPYFDATSGIVTVNVRAFAPPDAQTVSAALLLSAEQLVNQLSERANADRLLYASQSVEKKLRAWKDAEVALRKFRNANDVLFPTMQAGESAGLDGNLRAGESKARAALDALRLQGVADDAPQARTLRSQIASIQAELRRTQTQITHGEGQVASPNKASFASLVTSYDGLDVDVKIASKAYELALMAEQRARDEANQQRVYLDAFVQPAVAEKSMYPVRWRGLVEVAFGAFAAWCLGMLLYRAVIDHID